VTLAFTDLETTGLDTASDDVLEVGCIVTDDRLIEIARYHAVVRAEREFYNLPEIVRDMHTKSGLWAEATGPEAQPIGVVDLQFAAFLRQHAVQFVDRHPLRSGDHASLSPTCRGRAALSPARRHEHQRAHAALSTAATRGSPAPRSVRTPRGHRRRGESRRRSSLCALRRGSKMVTRKLTKKLDGDYLMLFLFEYDDRTCRAEVLYRSNPTRPPTIVMIQQQPSLELAVAAIARDFSTFATRTLTVLPTIGELADVDEDEP